MWLQTYVLILHTPLTATSSQPISTLAELHARSLSSKKITVRATPTGRRHYPNMQPVFPIKMVRVLGLIAVNRRNQTEDSNFNSQPSLLKKDRTAVRDSNRRRSVQRATANWQWYPYILIIIQYSWLAFVYFDVILYWVWFFRGKAKCSRKETVAWISTVSLLLPESDLSCSVSLVAAVATILQCDTFRARNRIIVLLIFIQS